MNEFERGNRPRVLPQSLIQFNPGVTTRTERESTASPEQHQAGIEQIHRVGLEEKNHRSDWSPLVPGGVAYETLIVRFEEYQPGHQRSRRSTELTETADVDPAARGHHMVAIEG